MRLTLTPADWVICIGALAFNVLLGLYFALRARRKADSSSFFLAGRSLTWPIVGASLFATNIGGFGVVAYTDAIQSRIMLAGSAHVLFIGLHKVGGWGALCQAVQHSPVPNGMHMHRPWTDPTYPFWGVILGAIYGGIFYWGMDQVNVQRLLGARDLKQARWGAMFAALLKLTPVFIFALPGVIALALYPNLNAKDSRDTFVWILENLLPTGIRGYVLAALLGAVLCSTIAVMNSISTLAVRDFILRF